MKKGYHVVLITLCVIPVLLMSIVSMFDADKKISLRENRTLAQRPTLSLASYLSGDFSSGFEAYYSDNFPLRDFFLDVNQQLTNLKGFDSPDGVEIIISDGPVDLGRGENDLPGPDNDHPDNDHETGPSPTPDITDKQPPVTSSETAPPTPTPSLNEGDVENFTSIIIYDNRAMELFYYRESRLQYYIDMANRLQAKLPDRRIYSLIAPTSTEFYSPEKYHSLTQSQKDAIRYIYSKLDSKITTIDAYDEISRHTNEYLYFRTDHHWTARGAYYAYRAFARKAGFEPIALEQYETARLDDFLGSFYRSTQSDKLKKNPDYVELFLPFTQHTGEIFNDASMDKPYYKTQAVRTNVSSSNKYLAFIGGDAALTVFRTEVKNGKKIIVIKESFANAFIPFLLPHYEEIYIMDPRMINTDLCQFVRDHGIQEVLLLNYSIAAGNQKYVNLVNNLIKD